MPPLGVGSEEGWREQHNDSFMLALATLNALKQSRPAALEAQGEHEGPCIPRTHRCVTAAAEKCRFRGDF